VHQLLYASLSSRCLFRISDDWFSVLLCVFQLRGGWKVAEGDDPAGGKDHQTFPAAAEPAGRETGAPGTGSEGTQKRLSAEASSLVNVPFRDKV